MSNAGKGSVRSPKRLTRNFLSTVWTLANSSAQIDQKGGIFSAAMVTTRGIYQHPWQNSANEMKLSYNCFQTEEISFILLQQSEGKA